MNEEEKLNEQLEARERLLRRQIEHASQGISRIRDKIATLGTEPQLVGELDNLLREIIARTKDPTIALNEAKRIETAIDVGLR